MVSSNNDNDNKTSMPWVQISTMDASETEHLLNNSALDQVVTATSICNEDAADFNDNVNNRATDHQDNSNPSSPDSSSDAQPPSSETVLARSTEPARIAASGTAGCILGCLICGPIMAILTGCGLAYASTSDAGPTGDVARAMGDVTIATYAKAVEVDTKYNVSTKTKETASGAWKSAKKLENEHHICERSGKAVVAGGKAAVDFAQRHRLPQRGAEKCTTCLNYVAQQISSSSAGTSPAVVAPVTNIVIREGGDATVASKKCAP